MFTVDYPYEAISPSVKWIDRAPLSEAEREALCHGNAERLLRIPPASSS